MDFALVLAFLEEEKRDLVSEKRQIMKDRQNFGAVGKLFRKVIGDLTYEEDILRVQKEVDEFEEAIRILNLAKSVENS